MDRMEELLAEMPAVKKEKNLEMLFLAVVNIVELRSQLGNFRCQAVGSTSVACTAKCIDCARGNEGARRVAV